MNAPLPSWYDVIDGTWPAASYRHHGVWTLREGCGGGSRVSATTLAKPDADFTEADIDSAETAMLDMGQSRIFMIRKGETVLDQHLAQRGYALKDPVTIYVCPPAQMMDEPIPRVTVFSLWEPLAIMREIWAAGGIGASRLAIMDRARGPKTSFLCRHKDKPAGAAYAAFHDGVVMVHAIEILAHQRRCGMGRWVMRAAAFWADEQGAETLSVMCTVENTAANALYTSLGMRPVGQYHYRHLPDGA
ncbi:GNAT family N-acetyltransferase [Sedimentitalea todarodis]|uniref:GNAT family N-acetyltransferase n=1 Tax=Sedimentitalea todarodis TaxID=1631240 RepID=A0ABU3VA76_9RHOB|nr:GNAT family N-acetyltransferase [Sedimentitalea todarodis]MDU9003068.1 GNAT family N-acetyltransferase [Sedimentitalea todarodis]